MQAKWQRSTPNCIKFTKCLEHSVHAKKKSTLGTKRKRNKTKMSISSVFVNNAPMRLELVFISTIHLNQGSYYRIKYELKTKINRQ